jgi:ribosome production factor 2
MAPTQDQQKAAKAKVLAGGKPAKARVQRYLKSIEPHLREGSKRSLLLKGIRCSQAMGIVLKDMRAMQSPHCKFLTKKNAIVAFETEGQHSLEFLTTKNDSAIFALASTNKKRPNNLVIGRTFDHQILDMAEVGLLRYKSIQDFGGSVPKKRIGSKPLMMFLGDLWQQDSNCQKMQNLLMDFYRGDVVDKIVVSGLDHLMMFVASKHPQNQQLLIHQHVYFMKLKKDPNNPSSTTPVPLLIPCGPDMTMAIRRTQFASPDLWKAALKQPHALKKKKLKNHSTNIFGETIGRLHLSKQDVDKMGGRKSKALRRAEKTAAGEEREALENELNRETESMSKEFQQTYGFEQQED